MPLALIFSSYVDMMLYMSVPCFFHLCGSLKAPGILITKNVHIPLTTSCSADTNEDEWQVLTY